MKASLEGRYVCVWGREGANPYHPHLMIDGSLVVVDGERSRKIGVFIGFQHGLVSGASIIYIYLYPTKDVQFNN